MEISFGGGLLKGSIVLPLTVRSLWAPEEPKEIDKSSQAVCQLHLVKGNLSDQKVY